MTFTILVLTALTVAAVDGPAAPTARPLDGAEIYAAACASCHGETAAGDGPDAALFTSPPPALDAAARDDADALVRRILDGARGSLPLDAAALRRRADRGEALVSHLRRLASADWPLVERGRSRYLARCRACHGPFGRPLAASPSGMPRPRALSDPAFQAATDDATLRTAVRHLRPGMPPLSEAVDDSDARALTAYVRLLSPGYELYERLCAGCHGEEGIGAPSARAPRGLRFDRAYMATHDGAWLRSRVWHMLDEERPAMPHFRGVLREDEARAIVAFLKARQRRPR